MSRCPTLDSQHSHSDGRVHKAADLCLGASIILLCSLSASLQACGCLLEPSKCICASHNGRRSYFWNDVAGFYVNDCCIVICGVYLIISTLSAHPHESQCSAHSASRLYVVHRGLGRVPQPSCAAQLYCIYFQRKYLFPHLEVSVNNVQVDVCLHLFMFT